MSLNKHFPPLRLTAVVLSLGLTACANFSGIAPQATVRDDTTLKLPGGGTAAELSATWWQGFGDTQLNTLIERGLHGNPNLKVAQARLSRAQAVIEVADAALLPQVNGGLDLTHQRYTKNGAVPAPLAGSIRDTGTLQLSGGWEMDFFGKYSSALDAAIGTVNAAKADAEAARVLLASQITRSYVQLARLTEQLAVAQRTLAQREELLKLVRDRYAAGLDTQLELRQSEGGLPDARYQIEVLQEQLGLTRNAIAELAGDPQLASTIQAPTLAKLQGAGVATQLPADLLGRRADIVAARWRVEAGTQDVASAKAQFYPNINLAAYLGFSSIGLNRLTDAGSLQWGVGPAIRLPIFEGGRLRANLRGKTADLDAAIESYNATVIGAMREVSDQVLSSQSIARQQAEQRAAQQAAEGAYDIALQRYQAGLASYLQVLTTENNVLLQRRQAVDLRARALDNQVALIRALGGGYQADATAQAAPR